MQTISLVKGQKVDLTKGQDVPLTKVTAGGGWKPNQGTGPKFDLDLFAITLDANGKAVKMAYFNEMSIPGIKLNKDNRDGEGEGDDEQIDIDFPGIPNDQQSVLLGVNIYDAAANKQNFGMVQNAYIRLFRTDVTVKDTKGDDVPVELMKYDLSEDYGNNTAVILGKLYRREDQWKFEAIGEGKSGELDAIFASYK